MLQKNTIKFAAFCCIKMTFRASVLFVLVVHMGLNPAFTFAQSEEMKVLGEVNDLLELSLIHI